MSKHNLGSREKKRAFYSFILFVCVSLLSVSLCVRAYILNPNTYIKALSTQDYVDSLCDDAKKYATDMCQKYYITDEYIGDAVAYENVYALNSACLSQSLGDGPEGDVSIISNAQEDFSTNIYNIYAKGYDNSNIALTDSQREGLRVFADNVAAYTANRATLSFFAPLKALTSTADRIVNILVIVLLVLTIAALAKLYTTGRTRYRSIRGIVVAFESAALLDLSLVLGVEFVKRSKTLVLYPTYLRDAIMSYVNHSEQTVLLSAVLLLVVSLILLADIWYRKYNS